MVIWTCFFGGGEGGGQNFETEEIIKWPVYVKLLYPIAKCKVSNFAISVLLVLCLLVVGTRYMYRIPNTVLGDDLNPV